MRPSELQRGLLGVVCVSVAVLLLGLGPTLRQPPLHVRSSCETPLSPPQPGQHAFAVDQPAAGPVPSAGEASTLDSPPGAQPHPEVLPTSPQALQATAPARPVFRTVSWGWPMTRFTGEQMSQQLYTLSEMLYMNKYWLQRDFVEPQLISQPRDSKAYEEAMKKGDRKSRFHLGTRAVQWSEMFDMGKLEEYFRLPSPTFRADRMDWRTASRSEQEAVGAQDLRVVPLDEYHRLTDYVIDQVILVGGKGDWRVGATYNPVTGQVVSCDDKKVLTELGSGHLEFFGTSYTVKRITCWPPHLVSGESIENVKKFLSAVDKNASHVVLSFGRGMLQPNWVDWKPRSLELEYADTSRAYVPHPWVYEMARTVRKQLFGDAEERNYLSVHWRRGDRGHAERGNAGSLDWKMSEPANLSKRICEVVKAENASFVFLLTNAGTQSDIDAVLHTSCTPDQRGQIVFLFPANILRDWRHEQHRMVVEQTIAVEGRAFLASGVDFWKSSAVSRFILERRLFLDDEFPAKSRTGACADLSHAHWMRLVT